MRTSSSPLLAIFRTPLQGRILAEVYLRERSADLSISQLARTLGDPVASVHREASRLVDSGLLAEQTVGRTRILSRPEPSLVTGPLTDLLAVTFGPLPVLTELLAEVEGIGEAFLYGSWAARATGEPGPAPRDVDVLVVGDADLDDLDEVAQQAERRLRREVNIRRINPERWRAPGDDPFLQQVHERPLVAIPIRKRGEARANR